MDKEVRDLMPEHDAKGWHNVYVGPNLRIKFSPNRQLEGHEPDKILRKTIDVALAGSRAQALRFDPFSEDAHYHIRPTRGGGQIPLPIEEGQTPLEAALAFFADPDGFRSMLRKAEPDIEIDDFFVISSDLADAAEKIRAIDAGIAA